ncbi:MAG TPA: tetratricopeptide repeat protein [Terriglobales bacterium]|nr:tetratricopeptide repeat protein [Terriglobales bacterium]
MVRPLVLARVLLLVVLCPAVAVHSQGPQYGSIVGQVRVSPGSLPSRAVLIELHTRGATIASGYTDNEGRFSFNGLMGNPYHVIINDPDYAPVDELVALDPSSAAVRMLNITLSPRVKEAKPAARDESIPGSNPNVTNPSALKRVVPESALREFKKGVQAEKRKKLEEAMRHYSKAVELAPEFYEARNNLGSMALARSDFAVAREQFQAAMRINPSEASSYFNMANLMLLSKQPLEAQRLASEGLRLQPGSAFGHFVLGSALGNSGNYAEAERELRRALELDTSMTKAHLALVNVYLQQQRKDLAAAELKMFLKSAPQDPLAPKAQEVLKRLEAEN